MTAIAVRDDAEYCPGAGADQTAAYRAIAKIVEVPLCVVRARLQFLSPIRRTEPTWGLPPPAIMVIYGLSS
jgi:hypothetical protein